MLDTFDPAGEVESTNEEEYDLVDPATLAKDTKLPPIVRLVNLILSDAASAGATSAGAPAGYSRRSAIVNGTEPEKRSRDQHGKDA